MKDTGPRRCNFMGMATRPTFFNRGTWLEPEEFAYPGGGKQHRRVRALCADGKTRIFRCGISDTYWTIPCKGGGWVSVVDGVIYYHEPKQ